MSAKKTILLILLFQLSYFLNFLSLCKKISMAKGKYYVVWKGRKPGIYKEWSICKKMVDGFDGAAFKSFPSLSEAERAFSTGQGSKPQVISKKIDIITPSISVDAACSGNPGVMEYQGVDTHTKEVLFHKKYSLGTNNIGEFLALVHGLAFLKNNNSDLPIYSDSVNALKWIKNKTCKTTLIRNKETFELFETIGRAEDWLKNNTWKNPLIKWETENWGEIPADFGRK
jgi:ribonuclease HI